MEEYTQPEKVIIWTIGALQDFVDMGLMNVMPVEITPEGTAAYEQLSKEFTPTDDEITFAVLTLMREGDDTPGILMLLCKYAKDKDAFTQLVDTHKVLHDPPVRSCECGLPACHRCGVR